MKHWIILVILILSKQMLLAQMDTSKKAVSVGKIIQNDHDEYLKSSKSSNDLLLQQASGVKQQGQKKVTAPKVIIIDSAERQHPVPPVGNQGAIHISPSEITEGKKIITGPTPYDSRVEVRSLDPSLPWVQKLLFNARSVAIVVDRSRLIKVSSGYYQIDASRSLGAIYQLCPGEAFKDQPVLGTGTAMVTGKMEMLTASHVFAGSLSNYAVVFGFEIYNKTGGLKQLISTDSVFFPKKIMRSSAELDISMFSVDRELPAPPLVWSTVVNPRLSDQVYMIGHPYGLPKKVSANASIVANNELAFFYTSLDAFEGNSGSPVFDLNNNQVIGILVGGETDFIWNGTCNVSNICSIPYCPGEKVVRITAIRNLLGLGR
ncbi:trypsin-like peptidase domain-containing protein [Mucilaginibacter sp. HC2]|uniref:S1 family peptidase n=1 Tax=Mucilaginibacter inviolabilis TaxID=2714892 RepID=UPI00140DBF2A|nr:serine protease [Mucilaginibacter inviolabilis]NHA03491.1 trypsin-like peptidase domain-containing protein [Mucilaginibacter inviolabilis]